MATVLEALTERERLGSWGASDWPSELSEVVAAALDNPRTGSVIFQSNMAVLHATANISAVIGLGPGQLAPGSHTVQILRANACFAPESMRVLETAIESAVRNPDAGVKTAKLNSIDGSRMIIAETRRIGRGCWISTFEDVTSRQGESHLAMLALQDPLTGLGNRMKFEQSVTEAIGSGAGDGTAVILLDLDRFKAVNDTLGHPTGDALLRLVSQRLQATAGENGMAARLGGDEFAILISAGLRPAEIAGLAGRMIDIIKRAFMVNGQAINVGASIGISVFPSDGQTVERLMKNADLALYHSKAMGRGRFFFFEQAMEERAAERRTLELEFRKAMPMRQLEVHYIPQVATVSQTLLGFEATLRWRHPQRGLLEPSEFITLAEELGLTVQIGDWMLRVACRQAAKWPKSLKISISTSWPQFERGQFVESVIRALEAASLPGNRLEIQVTESVLLQNEECVFATLHNLRSLGVHVAMDEFGTGYASLSQLANFPFDRVSIDRQLLVEGAGNAKHRAIVRGIAALAASLGIYTVGEGIETADELARIHSDGCTWVQGHLPASGVPEGELQRIISSQAQMAISEDKMEEQL